MTARFSLLFICALCALFLTTTITSAQFPEDGVVGYWSFDDGTINGKNVKDVLGEMTVFLKVVQNRLKAKLGKHLNLMVKISYILKEQKHWISMVQKK